jgi:rhodanese-related sulfurtransferase
MMELEVLIRNKKGTVVDVRTNEEFAGGHVEGSLNIPLQEIGSRMEEIKQLETPIILCCASGGRSGMAQEFLSRQGIACLNAGPWLNVELYKNKN